MDGISIASARLTHGPLTTDLDVLTGAEVRPTVIGLSMRVDQASGVAIDAKVLRQIADQIDDWAEYVVAEAVARQYNLGRGTLTVSTPDKDVTVRDVRLAMDADTIREKLRRSRRSMSVDDDTYAEVAKVYLAAQSEGLAPRQAVADHFARSVDRASQLIRGARDRGYLPDTTDADKKKGRRK